MASYGGKRIPVSRSRNDGSIMIRANESGIIKKGKKAACDLAYVGKKLLKSTGKAAWYTATTFLVIGLPLILELEREQHITDFDLQNQALLGASPAPPPSQVYGQPM